MAIEIITAEEADQLIALRKPLAWPPHTSCNGNCQQGRACDCTAAVADEWEETQWQDEAWFWGGILAALTVLIVCSALMVGWRP